MAELFVSLVPKALSEILQKVMKDKLGEKYIHTLEWWKSHTECMSRAPPTGVERITFRSKGPDEWEMNLLLKVIKYSNFEPLERYEAEWSALDRLIETRNQLFERTATKKVPVDRMGAYFECVSDDVLSKFDLETELEARLLTEIDDDLKTSKTPLYLTHCYIGMIIVRMHDVWMHNVSTQKHLARRRGRSFMRHFSSRRKGGKILRANSMKEVCTCIMDAP